MVTEVDHQAVKNRIIAILQDNSSLWDPDSPAGKFRKMLVGSPDGNIAEDEVMPYLFITNDDLVEEDEITSTVQGNVTHTSTHTIRYLIIYMAKEKDGATTEATLDDFGKIIKEQLKGNYDLRDPTAGTDPKAARSFPGETRILNRELIGRNIQGRVITLTCTIHTT